MTIQVTREAVCLADDQLEPLELTLEFGAQATLEDLTGKLACSGFLHFSSTCRVLVGRSAKQPLLKLRSRRGSLAVEYLVAADTRLADAVVDSAIDFRFERAPVLRPAELDLARRRPVWLALSDLFLDTDVNLFREGNVRTLAATTTFFLRHFTLETPGRSLAEADTMNDRVRAATAATANRSTKTSGWSRYLHYPSDRSAPPKVGRLSTPRHDRIETKARWLETPAESSSRPHARG